MRTFARKRCRCRRTGAAGVDVYATDELDVTVSGAGRVTYSGNPKVNKRVSGAGQVIKKEGISAEFKIGPRSEVPTSPLADCCKVRVVSQ